MRLVLQRYPKRFEIKLCVELHAKSVPAKPADDAFGFLLSGENDDDALAADRGWSSRAGTKAFLRDIAYHDILHIAIPVDQACSDDAWLAFGPLDLAGW